MSVRVLEGGRKSYPPPTGSIDWFLLTLVHVVSAGDEQDDLESLLYIMVYLLYGRLPWSPEKPATRAQTLSLADTKRSFHVQHLSASCPDAFQLFLDICREDW